MQRAERLVHFIYLGGNFEWQHWRAIETAKVHEAPIWIWRSQETESNFGVDGDFWKNSGVYGFLAIKELALPDWLRDHPIGLANVKDLYAWRILHEYGGLYLDLDTISLKPVWDLLIRDVLVSREWPNESDGEHQYNSAVIAARKGALALAYLAGRAQDVLASGESRWGKTGPHLLTEVVAERPDDFDIAPFGVLSGWQDDTIEEYYDGARPGPEVRVIHLYSSSRPERFLADRWWPE